MKSLLKYPILLAFALFLYGFFAADLITPTREFSEFENAYLADRPRFSLEALLERDQEDRFTTKYEEYVSDQFILRDEWITVKSISEWALAKIENNGILYGDDHYMFEKYLATDEDRIQKSTGFIQEFMELFPQFEHVTFSLIPNSYEILTDKLPEGADAHQVDQLAYMDEVYRQMAAAGAEIVDFRQTLSDHAQEYIYYRTDHHWTTYGAYLAYCEFIESLGKTPVPLEEMANPTEVTGFYGTYFSKAKLFNAVPDVITYYDIPVGQVTVNGQPSEGIYAYDRFALRDKYSGLMQGNKGFMEIQSVTNRDHVEGRTSRILVIKDSYANSLIPYLLYHFDEVDVLDPRNSELRTTELLASKEYDEVLVMYNFMNYASDASIAKLTY